jgi:hypothetical protein
LFSVNSGSDSDDDKDVAIKKVGEKTHTRVQNGPIIIGPEDDVKLQCVICSEFLACTGMKPSKLM